MNIFIEIKNRVDIVDVAKRYGIKLNSSLKAKCPLHNEKTASFKIYKNTQTFKCFGCGVGGDVVNLISKLCDVRPKRAAEIIDSDYGLNLFDKPIKMSRYEQIIMAQKKEAIELEKKKQQESRSNYWDVLSEWKRLDDNKRTYTPKNVDEDLHELFIEALQKLSYQEHLLDIAEVRYGKY